MEPLKIVIIGGVAAGTKAAAKIKRENRSASVEIYTKSRDISYAGCGLPYYVGGAISTRAALVVNSPQKFTGLTGAAVFSGHEALSVDCRNQTVLFLDRASQTEKTVAYDRLIIATGAVPIVPSIKGVNLRGVFSVRTPDDAVAIRSFLKENPVRNAVVVGAGFIGMEMAENLKSQGLSVTVIDKMEQILPSVFDPEIAGIAKCQLEQEGLSFRLSTGVSALLPTEAGTESAEAGPEPPPGAGGGEAEAEAEAEADCLRVASVVTENETLPAELVVLCIGIKPSTEFLADAGFDRVKGALVVNPLMETNVPNVYAVGDCALVHNRVTGERQWSAMGSTANICARALAKTITGHPTPYPGCLGTGVVRLSDRLNGGRTGLSEAQAAAAGFRFETVVAVSDDKAHYYPGSASLIIKLIAERTSKRLLGLQVLGKGAVDKITDLAVMGISTGMRLSDFELMDFSYAPPFSTAIHPLVSACGVLENKIDGALQSLTPVEYETGSFKGAVVIDVQAVPTVPGAVWMDLNQAEKEILQFPKETPLLLVCTRGKRAYMLQNRIRELGYRQVKVLEGGVTANPVLEGRCR